ncbi:hypothetical protein C351_00390 [Cryptococcus neoformans c8]|nr:hypothetical protein C351_00390 [Cryptococcus neoformans var. grubii c8]
MPPRRYALDTSAQAPTASQRTGTDAQLPI